METIKSYLVIGLGNTEDRYLNTRHNLGFMVVDKLVKDLDIDQDWSENSKLSALIIVHRLSSTNQKIVLAKPITGMNLSGIAVAKIIQFFNLKIENLIVIYDELDLPLGKIKVKHGGGSAGHHGVESIIQKLASDQFTRVRVGVGDIKSISSGRGGYHFDGAKYVLSEFTSKEKTQLKQIIYVAIEAVKTVINQGVDNAHKLYN